MSCKPFALLFLCVLLAGSTFAQDTLAPNKLQPNYSYHILKLPLANFLDLNSPNLQVGIEQRLDKHNSIQLLAGFSVDPNLINAQRNWYSVFNGYRIKGEYRRYFHIRKRTSFYLAADLFYTAYSTYTYDSFTSAATGAGYIEHFTLRKKMFGSDVKWGVQKQVGQHFMFETFVGLGYKYKIATQTGRNNPYDQRAPQPPAADINLFAITNMAGSYGTVSMPLNFVIGYTFR